MGFLNRLFNSDQRTDEDNKETIHWIPLTTIDQLDGIVSKSKTRTQIIFKHSTTCGISSMVFNRFGSGLSPSVGGMDFHYLDLLAYRPVSQEVVERFQIIHQSPQVLIIKNGEVVAHDSHGSIMNMNVEKYG